ncbi:hypothetical protein T07_5779 [Trichinella nelsoni]|uniref:Uncharacterized protein n=1 Tax=Trichinella nelsoni TaxID=6336 RepID=A0A0V0RQA5_9BILA|nr:hypothetical protein T07_5779 [Trichinella nelsoni]
MLYTKLINHCSVLKCIERGLNKSTVATVLSINPKYTLSCLIYFHQYFFSENVLSCTKIPCEIEDLEIEMLYSECIFCIN